MNLKKFNTGPALFLIIYQSLLILFFPFYLYFFPVKGSMVLATTILFFLTGISITAGYHRYFSHRAYKAEKPFEYLLLFFGTMAGQGSVLRWSYEHRIHHAYVDTDKDPYSIKKGFWYAHCLWLLEKPKKIDNKVIPDLLENPSLVFQHRYYELLFIFTNALAFLFLGWLLNDYMGAFVLSLFGRLFLLHHSTWFINSLAHTWGDKPFSQEQSAVNNYIISFLTFGEGYHNYHHTFANDYRNGIRWYHFDPTKWAIWFFHKLGLTKSLKRVDPVLIEKRMVIEHKRLLIDRIAELWHIKREELESKVNALSDEILKKLAQANELKQRYLEFQNQCQNVEMIADLKLELFHLKQSLREDFQKWGVLSREILKLRPLKT